MRWLLNVQPDTYARDVIRVEAEPIENDCYHKRFVVLFPGGKDAHQRATEYVKWLEERLRVEELCEHVE